MRKFRPVQPQTVVSLGLKSFLSLPGILEGLVSLLDVDDDDDVQVITVLPPLPVPVCVTACPTVNWLWPSLC